LIQSLAILPEQFTDFGGLLKYLRRRAGLTQRELSIEVGYSDSQISRMEQNQRVPDQATLSARFIPALDIDQEPTWARRLLELAIQTRAALALAIDGETEKALPGRYQLAEEIGRGGMGVIYRAYDAMLDREVAVKVLTNTDLGEAGRERLRREAQAAAKLNHPNIVSIYDVVEINDRPSIVMELVKGETLQASQPREMEAIAAVARQICAALGHAHAHGIIHRDLKPENIFITTEGTIKLMDFGLAWSRGASRLTAEGALIGTVFYLAPEQAMGQEIDGRTDLYSLGILLYELTTGRLPFTAEDPIAVISQHLYAPVVPPRAYNQQIPPTLDGLIVRLISKRPEDRPASAAEVLQALEHLDLAEAASAGELSLLERIARGRLVDRASELNQLRELWSRALQGRGHLALISGEPGIGKTRLAREISVVAQLDGAVVLSGECYEYEASAPYLPFVECLRAWAEAQTTEALCLKLGTAAPEMAKLIPELEARLGPLTPNPPLPPNEERLHLFDNMARFIQALAAPQGLLIFLDDLHWADQGTLALLHYLLRRLRESRVLILAAYREVELERTHPLASALVEWNRERLATRVALGRLSVAETGTMLAALFEQDNVSAEFSEAIHRETEGNPFFIEEVVKSLVEQGEIYREEAGWGRKEIAELTIPQSIKDAIGRRLNRLSAGCVDMLHAAAALGKIFSFSELSAVAGVSEDRLLDAIDEASAAQLIRVQSGDSFAFTHDKIREVLYEELNPIRRRRLHQRIGEGLENLYTIPSLREVHIPDMAHHFINSGDLQKGLTYSLEAAAQARRVFALDEALHYYQHAAESAEALGLSGQLADIHETMGDVYTLHGVFQAAVEHRQMALDIISLEDSPRRAVLNMKIGYAYGQIGDPRGLSFLHRAERELDPTSQTNELAQTLTLIGRYHHYLAQHRKSIEYYERARQLAEPLDDVDTLFYLNVCLAGAYQHLTQFDESRAWARQSIALGERKNFPRAVAVGYEFLAENATKQGHWDEALEYAARDREIGEKIGALDRIAWAEMCRTEVSLGRGELLLALETGQAALALAEEIGETRVAVLIGELLVRIQTDLGNDEAARANGELWVERADQLGQNFMQSMARHGLAYRHVLRGEWAEAADLYDQCVAFYNQTENRVIPEYIGAYQALARFGLGRLDEAVQLITAHLALAREAEAPHPLGCALRVQGQIYAAQGLTAEARVSFDEAIAILDKLGSHLELGRAYYHRGLFQQKLGNAGAARDDLQRAIALFDTCGAIYDRQQAAQSL
jgi:tetratricopeptide (TPR) repeat protein/transcriptional regulator with XRE-family HTH domain